MEKNYFKFWTFPGPPSINRKVQRYFTTFTFPGGSVRLEEKEVKYPSFGSVTGAMCRSIIILTLSLGPVCLKGKTR